MTVVVWIIYVCSNLMDMTGMTCIAAVCYHLTTQIHRLSVDTECCSTKKAVGGAIMLASLDKFCVQMGYGGVGWLRRQCEQLINVFFTIFYHN